MFETGDAVKSSPAVDPVTGLVIVGSHDGHLYALDPQVGTHDGHLYSLDPQGESHF